MKGHKNSKGRPRSFDLDEALEKAMNLFWAKGYDGTTIPDLTSAIGVNRPSLYAAFGSKRALFTAVLDRYRSQQASYVNRAIAERTAVEVFESLMSGVIELVTDTDRPGGCLFVCAGLAVSEESSGASDELARRRVEGESDIRRRFERAILESDLPATADAGSLAKFAASMLWGISVQAKGGATRRELSAVADIALRAFKEVVRE